MELKDLSITDNRIKALNKKGIFTVEDIQNFFPRKYYDFTKASPLHPCNAGKYVAITGVLQDVIKDNKNGLFMLKAKVLDHMTGSKLHVLWMGGSYLYRSIEEWKDQDVIVCGNMVYNSDYHSYHMQNPVVFDHNIDCNLRVYPVYKKMSGISEEFMLSTIQKALSSYDQPEFIPKEYLDKYHLLTRMEAVKQLHNPDSMEKLEAAQKRMVYERLLTFAFSIKKREQSISKGTQYNIKSLVNTKEYIASLPFTLTESQNSVFAAMSHDAMNGLRVDALIQGDVGSGKTVAAFLMMFAMADSGYQSVLMAPTLILANQHYEKLKGAAERYGYKVAFLSSLNTTKEKKNYLEGIASGEYQFIIGTQSVLSSTVIYKNLALAVIDEEQKFGVDQRNVLLDKKANGVHTISMSGTPIPRSLAETLYGNSIKVYDLQPPKSRQKTKTTIFSKEGAIQKFILKMYMESKQQAYVVCPWIEDLSEQSNVSTVEETYASYKMAFEGTDIQVGIVTGKMKAQETEEITNRFKNGEIHVLISTTVIEVGVDVPNANIIVINNAERFGLSQLHQLRGRVGRGSEQGYCILNSKETENPRLKILCETTNGYEISLKDMELRGTGDILGTDQSGTNDDIELIVKYPNMYQFAKQDAEKMVISNFSLV